MPGSLAVKVTCVPVVRQEVSSQPQSVSPLPFSTVAVSVVLWPAVSVPVPLMLIVVASASTVTISCAVEKDAVDLNACLDRVGPGGIGLEGQAAAVLLHLIVDGPLDVRGVVGLVAQLDRGIDSQALALLDRRISLVQR